MIEGRIDKETGNRLGLSRVIILSILSCVFCNIFLVVISDAWGNPALGDFYIITLAFVWEIMALVGIGLMVTRICRLQFETFAVRCVVIGLLGILPMLLVNETWLPLKSNYTGLYSYSEKFDLSFQRMGRAPERWRLFRSSDPQIQSVIAQIQQDSLSAGVDTLFFRMDEFITWQAGLAKGYEPDSSSVPAFEYPKSIVDHALLCVTTGPVALGEYAIVGLARFASGAILFQLVYYVFRKRSIWM